MIFVSFISGITVGLEIFTGGDLDPSDKFAATLSLGIVRLTLVVPR